MAVYAVALFEYLAMDAGDLTFAEGDFIEITSREGEWWEGRLQDGREGYFPFNRVEIVDKRPGVNSLGGLNNVRANNEKVDKVEVTLKDTVKGRRKGICTFNLSFQAGMSFEGEKTMHDFRRFDKALRILDPTYEFTVNLSPEWADEVPLSQPQGRDRAELLGKYLRHNTKGREIFDVLLTQWAQANKKDLRTQPGDDKAKISPTDNRTVVITKITSALAFVYKKQFADPCRWFLGPTKTGELAQAAFEWAPRDATELSLAQGDYVMINTRQTRYNGWWYGQTVDGAKGLFPSNYVIELKEADIRKRIKVRKGSPEAKNRATQPGHANAPRSRGTLEGLVPPPVTAPPSMANSNAGPARDRKTEPGFSVKSVEAYEELRSQGFTLESMGRHLKAAKGRGANQGDFVSLSFSAFVWDPQTQQLREFCSSDKLKAPPKGIAQGEAGASGIKMEFVVGDRAVIDGLDEAVRCISQGTNVRLVLAPSKGYGDVGSPPEIPGNCYLVYDLTLDKVSQGGTFAPPRRDQVFSVGISRPNVMMREPSKRGISQMNGSRGGNNNRPPPAMGYWNNQM